jgi:gamma-glutamylcyclotransferase (GGCT)/AIG2-like uncharacterized protein YtfP
MAELDRVFVYGTLRLGGRYRPLIDEFVVTSRPATVRARMYHFAPPGSRGEYPFIEPSDGVVHGEVLVLRDLARALEVLDRIEEAPDLYERRVVEVTYADDGSTGPALAYFIRGGRERRGLAVLSGDWLDEVARDSRAEGPQGSEGPSGIER